MIQSIAVAGAGTMGTGIALTAAQHGFSTVLLDVNEAVVARAQASIQQQLDTLLAKQKITADEKSAIENRLIYTSQIEHCKANCIIEAIVEKLDIKVALFRQLAVINANDTIFASNTSSLSINQLQQAIPHPERVAGLHFFNPATLMKLVEVVKGSDTSDAVINSLQQFCQQIGKTAVLCIDSPGFIVNRVARHYYLEAMHLHTTSQVPIAAIDALMEASGFKMGPFKLMDLIGNDINLAVSQSLYEASGEAPRFKPALIQVQKVAAGHLGKKTGEGFYTYTTSDKTLAK